MLFFNYTKKCSKRFFSVLGMVCWFWNPSRGFLSCCWPCKSFINKRMWLWKTQQMGLHFGTYKIWLVNQASFKYGKTIIQMFNHSVNNSLYIFVSLQLFHIQTRYINPSCFYHCIECGTEFNHLRQLNFQILNGSLKVNFTVESGLYRIARDFVGYLFL